MSGAILELVLKVVTIGASMFGKSLAEQHALREKIKSMFSNKAKAPRPADDEAANLAKLNERLDAESKKDGPAN